MPKDASSPHADWRLSEQSEAATSTRDGERIKCDRRFALCAWSRPLRCFDMHILHDWPRTKKINSLLIVATIWHLKHLRSIFYFGDDISTCRGLSINHELVQQITPICLEEISATLKPSVDTSWRWSRLLQYSERRHLPPMDMATGWLINSKKGCLAHTALHSLPSR